MPRYFLIKGGKIVVDSLGRPLYCEECARPLRLHPAGTHEEVVLDLYGDGSVKEVVTKGHLEAGMAPGGRNWSVKSTDGGE